MNNANRQIVSTQNGCKKASRKYILKLRTDLILTNLKFLKFWDEYPKRNEKHALFKHRMICSCLYSREYSCELGSGFPMPFHPSDFWFFGLSEDIKDYFEDCPLLSEVEASNWAFKYPNRCPYPTPVWRYAPEQWFCLNWVKKHCPNVEFEDWSDWNSKNIEISNRILYNNFIFLGFEESGIYSKKHYGSEKHKNCIQGLITHADFEDCYKKFCDESFIPKNVKNKYHQKLLLHLSKLQIPVIGVSKWLGEIFSVIYYAVLFIISKIKDVIKFND